jgi:hypothetical protein
LSTSGLEGEGEDAAEPEPEVVDADAWDFRKPAPQFGVPSRAWQLSRQRMTNLVRPPPGIGCSSPLNSRETRIEPMAASRRPSRSSSSANCVYRIMVTRSRTASACAAHSTSACEL